ncbi:MAG TPA: hypothetical protein VF610_06515 [Segetibacter sp.]|jgi:hypothetical protein
MKKLIAPLVLVMVIAVSSGCKKIITNAFNGFDQDVPQIVLTIPATQPPIPGFPVPPNEVPVGSFKQSFNLDSTIKAKTGGAFGVGDVSSVKLKKMVFTLSNADAANNLANFESARLTFSSNTNATAVPLASFSFPDTYADSQIFTADANTPELIGYLNGSELTYNVFGKLRRYTTKPLGLAVVVTLTVK